MAKNQANPDGLMVGLEIHQRLDSGTKLFCNCTYDASRDSKSVEPGKSFKFTRRFRAVTGELGVIDPAARFEAFKSREIHYDSPLAHGCLVEEDDCPPYPINQFAFDTALKISLSLKSAPVDEVHVMRKTVVDGSAVSGFQRTCIISLGGQLDATFGPVGIQTVCLEEESSTKLEGNSDASKAFYNLDRLGVPLVEIATEPCMTDGAQAKEAAHQIGLLLRNIGSIQRGIGTIRQDVNISIREGARVEIKGVQDLASLAKLVDNEVRRQKALVQLAKQLEGKALPDPSKIQVKSVAKAFSSGSNCAFIKKALESGQQAMAVRLDSMGKYLGIELMDNHRLGTELSDYAKAAAGVNGIIHSGEDLSKYPITAQEAQSIASMVGAGPADGWAMCIGPQLNAVRALEAVVNRAAQCQSGVPKETRRADGERSRFMRPMSGSARMYPETDVPPVPVEKKHLESLQRALPLPFEEQVKELQAMGLNSQVAGQIVSDGQKQRFFKLVDDSKAQPTDVAWVAFQELTRLSREGAPVSSLPEARLAECLKLLSSMQVTRAAMGELIALCCKEPLRPAALVLKESGLSAYTKQELSAIVRAHASEDPKSAFSSIMREHRQRVQAKLLSELLGTTG